MALPLKKYGLLGDWSVTGFCFDGESRSIAACSGRLPAGFQYSFVRGVLMDDLIPLLVLVPLFILVSSVLGCIAFFRIRTLEERIRQLESRALSLDPVPARSAVAAAARDERVVAAQASRTQQESLWNAPPTPSSSVAADSTVTAADVVTVAAPDSSSVSVLTPAPVLASDSSASNLSAAPQKPLLPAEPGWLDRLTDNLREHWMIWLGGICVGLAGVFMVGYSIEQGLLGPQTRILLSLLAGAGLHAGAEYLRRRRGQNPVFAALAGGASIILYAALLAAFHWLPDTSAMLIFTALALVSFGSMALALKHGPVLAGLGMLGGYLVPILVNTGSGNIAAALAYISILTLFSLWLLGYVQRRWLWNGVIAGSLIWWAISFDTHADDGVRSLYLLVLAYMLLAVPRFDWWLQRRTGLEEGPWLALLKTLRREASDWPVVPALWLVVLAQGFTLAFEDAINAAYFSWLALPGLLLMVASRRPELNPLPILLMVLMLAGSVWPLMIEHGDQWLLGPVDLATEIAFATRLVLLGGMVCAIAVWLLRRGVGYPAFWTGLAVFTPIVLLATAYYVLPDFRQDAVWGLVAFIAGSGYLWLAEREQSQAARPLISVILISAGHVAFTLTAVIWLVDATLTLGLALQLVSLAWLQQRYELPLLRWVIRAVLLLVLARLTLNPWLLTYDNSTHWSLWTYGGATLCTAAAAWVLRAETRMQPWLQGGAAQLLVLTLAAEIRYWLYNGDVFHHDFSFTEASLDVVIWGAAAVIYYWRSVQETTLPVFYRWLGRLHLAAATAVYVLVLMLADNPLWSYVPLSATPILNILLVSYGLPTLIMLVLWRLLPSPWARYAAMAAGANLLWFVSIEIRHLWQAGLWEGQIRLYHGTPDGELYTYSVVWMLMAAAALTFGSWFGKRDIYRAGMALLLLVVAKLFVIDMAGLTGLWRVASFMGLGLALLGLAWIHQNIGRALQQRALAVDNSSGG